MGQINCSLRSLLTWLAASSLLAAGCVSTDEVSGAPDEGAPDLTTGEFAGHTAPSLGPVGQWEWHDVPGAVCGYGQQTGFAVNVVFLAMIVPAFPDASRVTLTGTSAGGFGSVLTYDHVSEAFGDKRVDLVTDSGPLLWIDPVVSLGFPVWNTDALIPADCPACLQNYTHLYSYLSTKYPASRFALLSHDQDLVISVGYLMLPFPEFYLTMNDFTRHTIGPNPNWKYFVAGGTGHGFLYNLRESSTEQVLHCNWQFGLCVPYWVPVTTVLADWLTQLVTDDPGWQSVSSIL